MIPDIIEFVIFKKDTQFYEVKYYSNRSSLITIKLFV
jgi:hypothetical protein